MKYICNKLQIKRNNYKAKKYDLFTLQLIKNY